VGPWPREIAAILRQDGIQVLLDTKPTGVEGMWQGQIGLQVRSNGEERLLTGSHLLLAAGRVPNTDSLNLPAAGIEVAELIELCNRNATQVLSLDVPSGLDATTGETPGVAVRPDRTLTLALPKTGLAVISGEIYLADIGIPPEVFRPLGLSFAPLFRDRTWISLPSRQIPLLK
jgi:hypothetical protein